MFENVGLFLLHNAFVLHINFHLGLIARCICLKESLKRYSADCEQLAKSHRQTIERLETKHSGQRQKFSRGLKEQHASLSFFYAIILICMFSFISVL